MKRPGGKKPRPKPKARIQAPPALIERRFPHTRFVEIPQVKGKTIEKVELFTASEYHSITIDFEGETALTLIIEPCFRLGAELSDIKTGDQRTIQEWPPILVSTES